LFVGQLLGDDAMRDRYFMPDLAMPFPPSHLVAATAMRLQELGGDIQAAALVQRALDLDEGARTFFTLYLAAARIYDAALQTKARAQLSRLAAKPQDRVFGAALPLFDAIVAYGRGDTAQGAVHALVAADCFRNLGFPLWEAEALELCGEAQRAAAIYREIGAAPRRREALLHKAAKRPAGRAASDALSPRELEVAELVAAGATNAAVAEKLSITVKGVEKHLSSIYAKLAIASRAQLATHFPRASSSS